MYNCSSRAPFWTYAYGHQLYGFLVTNFLEALHHHVMAAVTGSRTKESWLSHDGAKFLLK